MAEIDCAWHRSLYGGIDWGNRLIGLKGPRGVGKTTLLLQHLREAFGGSNWKSTASKRSECCECLKERVYLHCSDPIQMTSKTSPARTRFTATIPTSWLRSSQTPYLGTDTTHGVEWGHSPAGRFFRPRATAYAAKATAVAAPRPMAGLSGTPKP